MTPDLTWLEDPTVFRVNRLDAHSDHTVYLNLNAIPQGKSRLYQSLDGQWKFHHCNCPGDRPALFWQEDYDDSSFGTITVPGHIETQGYGQIQYINKLYDWDGHAFLRPPQIDWENDPVGSYVRTFDLEPALRDKPVCISFQGAEQAIYVWLNGHFVGYSEDSFTPSEFDLTPYIRPTGNRLCVELYKRSSAAWLEDQDFFSFSGLFRSVYLYAKLPVWIEDVWFRTNVSDDLTEGLLQIRLKTDAVNPHVHLSLINPEGKTIIRDTLKLTPRDGFLFSQSFTISDVKLWEPGSAHLYNALLSIEDGGFIPYDIGFRRFEIVDKVMMLNGKRLMLNGVNRHEWNADSGRCITEQDMLDSIQLFHENNINAVRTCHYPNRSEWYFLCDREGISMMDETNMETHGSWQREQTPNPEWNIPGSLPEWLDCVLDRANSMFQRDKNHVSILFWSCGNESYAGTDIVAMSDFFHSQDSTRLVHYEGVYWCRKYDYLSDVESRMYATPAEIREYLENNPQKPFINCEYMHMMGNSLGGMESYVRLGEEFPMYQGGYLWDMRDQALWHKNAVGQTALGYGGDFGDRQSDYSFSANGLVTADGTPKPCIQEVSYWFLPPEKRSLWDEQNRLARAEAKFPLPPAKNQPLRFIDGDGAYGLQGDGFEVLFSKISGGPVSIVTGGEEWMWRIPKPTFWRAPTENDIGCGFPKKSAIWESVDQWLYCSGYTVQEQSPDCFTIRYDYTADAMPGLATSVTYRLRSTGEITVSCHYAGAAGRPQLPLFGLRFSTPLPVSQTQWLGLSGETYPDRYKGAAFGLHTETPHISNYLVPQECANHYGTVGFTLTQNGADLNIAQADAPFSFSALPYTPAQLQDAFHVEELPAPMRTVVTLCGAMRGVGGIDTWMTDVEPAYHVSAEEDLDFSFHIYL